MCNSPFFLSKWENKKNEKKTESINRTKWYNENGVELTNQIFQCNFRFQNGFRFRIDGQKKNLMTLITNLSRIDEKSRSKANCETARLRTVHFVTRRNMQIRPPCYGNLPLSLSLSLCLSLRLRSLFQPWSRQFFFHADSEDRWNSGEPSSVEMRAWKMVRRAY